MSAGLDSRDALVRRWYADGRYGPETLGALVARGEVGGRLLFSHDDGAREVTADAVVEDARRLAAGLRAHGVGAGAPVAVQVPSSPEAFALIGAVWLCGGVVVPVVDSAGPNELRFILDQSGAGAVAAATSWRGRSGVDDVRAAGFDGLVVAVGADVPAGETSLDDLRRHGRVTEPPHGVHADDIALVIYTSGTTAEPKGVQHTHNTVLAGYRPLGVAPPSAGPMLFTFPAGHIAGTMAALRLFVQGGDAIVMDRWSATRAAALVEEHRVAFSAGTPFYLQGLLDAAERDGRDLSSLRTFLTGAAPVPPALLERAAQAGISSWRSYGSTEHPSVSSGGPLDPVEVRHRTDGSLGDGVEVRFVDEAGDDVPAGEPGEILVRGPRLFVGYRDPVLDADAFAPGGWFRTGDIGRLDAEGHLVITDRKKDIIIRGGENIASKEVEDVLAGHPAVAEVAVVAQPDPALGEIVAAVVRLHPGHHLSLDDVAAHFRSARVPRHKVPEALHVVDDFPRTAAGKVRKPDLRARLTGA